MYASLTPDQLAKLANAAKILEDGAKLCEKNHIVNGDSARARGATQEMLTPDGRERFSAKVDEMITKCLDDEADIEKVGAAQHFARHSSKE